MTDNEARDYAALTAWARQLEHENAALRVVPPPWPSRGPSEPPTLEEIEAGHTHWMMSCGNWGWVQVQLVLDDGIMICADDAMMEHRWVVRVQLAGHPVKPDSVQSSADWRRCTEDGRPLPLPVWKGPSGETTTTPHPGKPGWSVEGAKKCERT